MQGKQKEQWLQLCEQAAVEKDPQKLLVLVDKINQMLDEKEGRLRMQRKGVSFGQSE